MKKGEYDCKDKVEQFFEYLDVSEKYNLKFSLIKNHALWFTKGIKRGRRLRESISKCVDVESVRKVLGDKLLN